MPYSDTISRIVAAIELKSVSFRTPSSKLEKIDKLAGAQYRDRSYILNEAIDQYLDMQNYHTSFVEQGLRDSEEGKTVSHEEVGRRLAKQRASRTMKTAR
jgi:predicted transcriptional regulator